LLNDDIQNGFMKCTAADTLFSNERNCRQKSSAKERTRQNLLHKDIWRKRERQFVISVLLKLKCLDLHYISFVFFIYYSHSCLFIFL